MEVDLARTENLNVFSNFRIIYQCIGAVTNILYISTNSLVQNNTVATRLPADCWRHIEIRQYNEMKMRTPFIWKQKQKRLDILVIAIARVTQYSGHTQLKDGSQYSYQLGRPISFESRSECRCWLSEIHFDKYIFKWINLLKWSTSTYLPDSNEATESKRESDLNINHKIFFICYFTQPMWILSPVFPSAWRAVQLK